MRITSFRSFAPLFVCLGLAACGPAPSSTPTTDAGTPGTAACARLRALNCPNAATCMSGLNPTLVGIPATCLSRWNTFVACIDSNAASLTCTSSMGNFPAPCMPLYAAVGACATAARDSGTEPGDASDAPGPSSLPEPSSGVWMADVSYNLSGGSLTGTEVASGSAILAPGPIGGPANAHILSFQWDNFLGSSGSSASCRVGLIYNSANASYTFSNDAMLTQPCVFMPMGEAATTLTFTGARVARGSSGSLSVTIDVTGSGPRFSGSGQLVLLWP